MSQADILEFENEEKSQKIVLSGCSSETILNYLKSLGVFKVISEQLDNNAMMYWKQGMLNLISKKTKDEVIEFMFNDYVPLPIVVPWSHGDFFGIKKPVSQNQNSFKKPPSKSELVIAYLANDSSRLTKYRETIEVVLNIIEDMDIDKVDINPNPSTKKSKKLKFNFLRKLRANIPEGLIDFLDVAIQLGSEEYFVNTLLGSGGGSDGNLNFGRTYMQSVWLALPDFKGQRNQKMDKNYRKFNTKNSLLVSLLNDEKGGYILDDTPGLLSPGEVKAPNSFEGFEAKGLRNPWDLIFAIEGVTLFAGSVSRRFGSKTPPKSSFPFTCSLSPAGISSLILSESNNKEIWFPIWDKPVGIRGLKSVLHEGRMEVTDRLARDGLEFARAVASLGIDRGISSFKRFGIIRDRVGQNHAGVNLDTIEVPESPRENIRLLEEIDSWLGGLRRSCNMDSVAEVFAKNLRKIENAIFDYCKNGGVRRLQDVLKSLGRAERDFASAGQGRPVPPLHDISPKWISACNDNSPEYRLACSLASVYDKEIGPIRVQMEPVSWGDNDKFFNKWKEGRKTTVWGSKNLSKNLIDILERRVLEGRRQECSYVPIDGSIRAHLSDVALFQSGMLDDTKLMDLFWGLSTVRWYQYEHNKHNPDFDVDSDNDISGAYAMLKLLFMPGEIGYSEGRWEILKEEGAGAKVKPEPRVIKLIKSGRFEEAFDVANRRIKVSGLNPMTGSTKGFVVKPNQKYRLLASLLFPIWESNNIAKKILKEPKKEKEMI